MHRSLLAEAALAGLMLLTATPAAAAAPLTSARPTPFTAEQGGVEHGTFTSCWTAHGSYRLTPAVTSGGTFSDARDTALAALPVSPAVSSDGVFSDARDSALGGLIRCASR